MLSFQIAGGRIELPIQNLHGRVGKERGRYAANRVLALLSRMFNLARRWGYSKDNPAQGIERFQEVKRERFLQPAERPRLFRAIAEEPHADMREYVLVSLLAVHAVALPGAGPGNALKGCVAGCTDPPAVDASTCDPDVQ